jgi:hypothetical protein
MNNLSVYGLARDGVSGKTVANPPPRKKKKSPRTVILMH